MTTIGLDNEQSPRRCVRAPPADPTRTYAVSPESFIPNTPRIEQVESHAGVPGTLHLYATRPFDPAGPLPAAPRWKPTGEEGDRNTSSENPINHEGSRGEGVPWLFWEEVAIKAPSRVCLIRVLDQATMKYFTIYL